MGNVWYRVDHGWSITITPVNVERSTDKMVILAGSGYKERKDSTGRMYFSDFDEAATFANKRIAEKTQAAQREIARIERNETELWVSIQRIRDAIKDGVI